MKREKRKVKSSKNGISVRHKSSVIGKASTAGITLIALVITIIVLLILAGITINLTIGQDGILKRAEQAGRNYTNAADYERTQLAEFTNTTDDIIASVTGEKTLVEAFNDGEIQIGDYVNYQNPTEVSSELIEADSNYTKAGYKSPVTKNGAADQTFMIDSNMKWRVLGLSEDGQHLLLTTESVMKKEKYVANQNSEITSDLAQSTGFHLYGALGTSKNGGINELNKICKIYTNNYADEVRSITIDDINKLCGVTIDIENGKVYKTDDETKTDLQSYRYSPIGSTYSYTDQYASPEDYLDNKKSDFTVTNIGYVYYGKEALSDELFDLLFVEPNGDADNYWLVSNSIRAYENRVTFGPGFVDCGTAMTYGLHVGSVFGETFYSDGTVSSYNYGLAVRPVVSLKSEVKLKEISKIE